MILLNLFSGRLYSQYPVSRFNAVFPLCCLFTSRFAVDVEDLTMLNKQLITYYWCSIKWWGMASKVSHYLIIIQW